MISIGQTLISPSQDFEKGFFSQGRSSYTFLEIWYKNTPHVVVWVANRNDVISDSNGLTFSISGNGSLVITRNESLLWCANPSVAVSNLILQLLDSGNLVLVNDTTEQSSSTSYIWQSFDYPADTWLPEMKLVDEPDAGEVKYLTSWRSWNDPSPGDFVHRIENQGLPELVTYRGKIKTWRNGKWNGLYFGRLTHFPNKMFKSDLVFGADKLISVAPYRYERSILRRSTIDISGKLHSYTMNTSKDKWNLVFTCPGDQCDDYGVGGPNSICSLDKIIRYQCLKGFAPKFKKEWDLGDWSGGCTRIIPLNCKSGDGFQEIRGVKYPDMLEFSLNTSLSLDECKTECLKAVTARHMLIPTLQMEAAAALCGLEISSIPETFRGQIATKTSMFAYHFQNYLIIPALC